MGLHVIRPGLVTGLVLNDIGPEINSSGLSRIWDVIGQDHPQPDWDAAEAWCHKHYPPMNLTDMDWRILAENTFVQGADGKLHVSWDPMLAETQRRISKTPTDLWPYFRATRRIPVLSIRGSISDVLSAQTAAKMAQDHSRLTQLVVDECGHAPNLTAPDILESLGDFFDQCEPSHRR